MGSASVPTSTSSYQQQAMGIWGSPQATALALPILKPGLANIKNQQNMLMGFQSGDPTQTAKFFGLPADASTEDMTNAIAKTRQGPSINIGPPINTGASSTASAPVKTAAHGGIMALGESESDPRRGFKAGSTAKPKTTTSPAIQAAATQAGLAPSNAYLGQAGYAGLKYNPTTGKYDEDNPMYNQAIGVLQGMETQPSQFGQATDAYNQAISSLQGAANYTPQQIAAQQATSQGYNAASMQAPQDIQAQGYTAAQMQGAQMRGPQQWSSQGAQQYMDPYIQSVLQNQLQLSNQQNAIANAGLKSQIAGQHAFGGTRGQLALGQQQFNQALANQNLVSQGLSNAYNTALGQFNTAQGQNLTAGQANLQAALTTQQQNQAAQNAAMQQYINNALAAAQTNYGGQLTAAQQNQVAQNAASQFAAQAANTANLQNAQLGTQAAMSNQSAGLQGNQQNISALSNAANAAQGLGALGSAVGNYNLNLAAGLGQAGSTLQTQLTNAANQTQANAQGVWNGPTTLANQGVTTTAGMGSGNTGVGGTNTSTQNVA